MSVFLSRRRRARMRRGELFVIWEGNGAFSDVRLLHFDILFFHGVANLFEYVTSHVIRIVFWARLWVKAIYLQRLRKTNFKENGKT